MKTLTLSALLMLPLFAQGAQTVTPCNEVLKSKSDQWVQSYTKAHGDNTLEQVKAILRYEYCYEQSLDQRKDKLDESGKGPLMGMMGNFRDLELALKEFTNLAIRACGQSGDRVRVQRAYAFLYQLQFRHFFYLQYEEPKLVPKTDMDEMKKQQLLLEAEFKKVNPSDAQLLQNRFDKLREAALEIGMPMQNVYSYAVMVMRKKGALLNGSVPF